MEKILLKAEIRKEKGKGGARSLRRQSMLPAVIYFNGDSTPIKLHRKPLVKLMASGAGEHALITLEIDNEKGEKKDHWALIKDYQLDPMRNELLHVDFMEISLDKKIKITVPIIITKEPIGVKNGGILQQQLRDVEVECLPTQIPDGIEVDASAIDIGHSLHVSDLTVKEGIRISSDLHDVILSITAPAVEEVAPVAAVEEEAKEPELVKKAKGKEGEEAAEAKEETKAPKK